ncbi:MAG TPA: choice-of-anchor tandem repeat GloVer-containing protein [Bryobacteraceae bacterium]|jgi:uncharacterized repeat protein (TIGR03803 family)|nr:choice-of-anchor tandem repeat GloVer-containing protein [Bryobacteraceae bacterium]
MRNLISGEVRRLWLASAPVLALALVAMQPIQAQTFTVLYTFTGGADGGTPLATPTLYNGYVYGTTSGGGTHANGTVYALNFESRAETVLHSFVGAPDGADPVAGLVLNSGNFYGVAYRGGAENFGTMFEVSPAGAFALLYSFTNPATQGCGPAGTMVMDASGDLYGTTYFGGTSEGRGTVFEYSSKGVYTTLKNFAPGGALPRAGLHLQAGKLYGATAGDDNELVAGAVYEVGLAAPLYTFTGNADGGQPLGALVGDSKGNLYGTASSGGNGYFGVGNGVIFKVNIASGQETILHTFTGTPDGAVPASALTWDAQGNLYGTTTLGGAFGFGTVFELSPLGELTILHSFTGGADGATPYAGVVVDNAGNVWGAASTGGSGYGTLFVISPAK